MHVPQKSATTCKRKETGMNKPTYDDNVGRLAAAHPALFAKRMPFYSDLANGWYNLVDKLCTDIERALGHDLSRRVCVKQIKEKLGTLRFYTSLDGRGDVHVDTISAGGGVRTLVIEPQADAPDSPAIAKARKRMRELVDAACDASASMCEECGAPGSLRRLSWVRTLCDEHLVEAQKRIARRVERRKAGLPDED
jgi:hypothetical protein